MTNPLEVRIADQYGINRRSLIAAIEEHYRTPEGKRVRVKIGQGEYIDGLPEGWLRLVNAS